MTPQSQMNDTISVSLFLDMIKAGAHRIISNKLLLNQMNVYPVSDRDTGSNMATLMQFMLSQTYSTTQIPLLLRQLADASLIGACGNSGMIFSAFFVGLASNEKVSNKHFFTIEELIDCLESGVKQAYQSVSSPTKGTILTVMSEWLEGLINTFKHTKDFSTLFERSVAIAEKALKETEFQLPILKRNNVVDAGAFGFVKFIQGMYEHLIKPDSKAFMDLPLETADSAAYMIHSHSSEACPELQYCMETLLLGSEATSKQIEDILGPISESLVITRSPNYVKVHAHTNDILQVTHYLKKYGNILHQKIDDMQKQWEMAHARKYRIALVTDSSADLPNEFLINEQIHVLNTQIRLGNNTFLDRLSIDFSSLHTHMRQENLTASTSTPSPELVTRHLSLLGSHYDSVIVIAVSSQLSGTYQMIANQAARIPSTPIDVIDSQNVSVSHGLLIMMAARYIKEGCSHHEIVTKIQAYKNRIKTFAIIDNFANVIKSGRIPKIIKLLTKWSFIKPMLTFNHKGKPSLTGIGLGKQMAWGMTVMKIKKLVKQTKVKAIGIAHTMSEIEAQEFKSYLAKQTGIAIDFVTEASCSMGLHIGQGCLLIAIAN